MKALFTLLCATAWTVRAFAEGGSYGGKFNAGVSQGNDTGPGLRVSLGAAQYGQSAGGLSFSANAPDYSLFSPTALQFSGASRGDVIVITNSVWLTTAIAPWTNFTVSLITNVTFTTNSYYDSSGTNLITIVSTNILFDQNIVTTANTNTTESILASAIRQVIAPQAVADIPTPPTQNGYVINLYYPSQVTATNGDGTRTFFGAPFISWMVTNPAPPAISEVQISKADLQYGGTKQWTYNYTAVGANGYWSVSTLGGIVENMVTTNLTSSSYEVIDTLQNYSGGPVVQQSASIYTNYTWSHCTNVAVSQTIVGAGSDAEATTYTYWDPTTFNAGSSVLIQSISHPDGSWEYYNNYDTNGNVLQAYSSFGDVSIGNRIHARETDYTINPTNAGVSDSGDNGTINPNVPRLTVEKINGTEISRRYTIFPLLSWRVDVQCTVPEVRWDVGGNLITINMFYTNGAYQGMPQAVIYPDGTMTTYAYATNVDGSQQTNTVVTGQPDWTWSYIVDGTSNVTVQNLFGFTVSAASYDVATDITLSQDTYGGFDAFGRPLQVTHLDGTTEYTSYACCGTDTTTDRDGVVNTYNYDTDHRLVGHTMSYGTISITYSNALDAVGQTCQSVRFGSDGSPIVMSQSAYDTAGELTMQINALGGTNTYAQTTNATTGGLIRTATNPDGGTITNAYYADGTLKSTTGTAVAGKAYTYGTDTDFNGNQCTFTTETELNADGTSSSQWTKTYTDMAGRTTEILYASASGSPKALSYYNSLGQLSEQVDPDGVATLYVYNPKGERVITVLKEDSNTSIDWSGPDRITLTTNYVTSDGTTNVLRTDTYVWDSNSNTSNLLSRTEIAANGLYQWNTTWSSGTAVTSSSSTAYSGGGGRSVTSYAPDGSYSVSAYSYGRLASTTQYDSTNSQIAQTTNGYDAHGRINTMMDARDGTTALTFNPADQVSTVTTPTPTEVTTRYYDTSERLVGTQLPDGTYTTNLLNPTGTTWQAYGSREYPVGNGYDSQGRMTTMTNWTTFLPPAGVRVTTWNYDAYRGWLSSKKYADNKGPVYGYTPGGRLQSRLWARGTNTTYGYSSGGDLASVSYSDDLTPGIGNGYDRLGHKNVITNGPTVTTLVYNDPGLLLVETNLGGPLGSWSVTNGYDSFMRRTKMVVLSNSTPVWTVNYTYDNASRLASASDGANSATYSYLANSSLVSQVTFGHSGTTEMTTSNEYDNLNRLTSIGSTNGSVTVSSSAYDYNSANQRTTLTGADGSYWVYGYDALGQVSSAVKHWSDGTSVAGEQFGNDFDTVGNRISSRMGGNENGVGLRNANYTVNNLNQYTSRTVPGAVDVIGSATNTATVTVNGILAYRHGTYYRAELPINNTSGPVWQSVTNSGVLGGSPNTAAAVTGSVFLPQNPETFTNDLDGNLTRDGRFTNYWDAENRLIGMTNIAGIATAGQYGLSFTYDYMGRRVQKTVFTNNTGAWILSSTTKFIYDGWNVVAILDGSNNLLDSFVWGSDLSGCIQGAGGVGGLVSMTAYAGANAGTYFYCYDGNGNVSALVNAANGSIAAQYEYGPFGEVIRATGPMANVNPFRFSTKYQDDETGLLYYGYRYYNSSTGRWLSRDPMGESTEEPNIYTFVAGDPILQIDIQGLWKWKGGKRQGGDRAIMLPDSIDTTGTAANFARLDPDETGRWLRDSTGHWVAPHEKINPCLEYSVPNTVVIGVGEAGGFLGVGRDILARWQVQLTTALEKRGFLVTPYRYDTGTTEDELISALRGDDVWGVALFGHGYIVAKHWYWPTPDPTFSSINGAFVWGGSSTLIVPGTIRWRHKWGLFIAFFCDSNLQPWDSLVSPTGSYYGADGLLPGPMGPTGIGFKGTWDGLVNQATQ